MTTKSDIDGLPAKTDAADAPKKRTRIVKRDTDHVYSASLHQGERYDSVDEERTHKRATVSKANDDKAAVIHALESEVLVPPRKNRGRPSKAYLDAQRAYEEAVRRQQEQIAEARAAQVGSVSADDDIPEFVRMQQTQAQVAEAEVSKSEVVKNVAPATAIEPETIDAAAHTAVPEAVAAVPETVAAVPVTAADAPAVVAPEAAALLTRLHEAYASGQYFVIDEDVPVFREDGFFSVADDAAYASSYVAEQRPSFDRIAEANILDAAKNLVGGSSETRSAKAAPAAAASKPAAFTRDIIIPAEGLLDIDPQGTGYLRSSDYNYMPSPDDIFVSPALIRANNLRHGDSVECRARAPKEGEKYYTVTDVVSVNGCRPIDVRDRISFEHLTPLFPDEQFRLSKPGVKAPLSCRIVDLFAPIGKGQRALIVAQPKTGKTILMKQIANAIAASYPDTYLMMLLIDERPEEVTDMARTVNAEVIASTFDEPAKRHVRIASLVLEKAKRMVECGRDVVIFLDSITRLARAFNTEAPTSGKILTGGVDANALQRPKRFFGAARNIEGGGSLTIIATALIDTGSKMDEVIFEEFKGTGNMELQLDRNLANKRIFPAVNLVQSSTRREDLLLDETTINRMFITRNYMADMSPIEAMNFIRKHLESTISNEEFIATIDK